MRILKLFETFNKGKIEELINTKKTYLFKKFRDFLINNNNQFTTLIGLLKNYDVAHETIKRICKFK